MRDRVVPFANRSDRLNKNGVSRRISAVLCQHFAVAGWRETRQISHGQDPAQRERATQTNSKSLALTEPPKLWSSSLAAHHHTRCVRLEISKKIPGGRLCKNAGGFRRWLMETGLWQTVPRFCAGFSCFRLVIGAGFSWQTQLLSSSALMAQNASVDARR